MPASLSWTRCVRLLTVAALMVFPACRPASRDQISGRASDSWTHTYPLAAGGEVEIVNRNGSIDIESAEGATVEIRAERVAHATTGKGAGDLLPRIVITEHIKPDHVSVQTEGIPGILVGVTFEVTYHVKAPAWAVVRAQTTSGNVTVQGFTGRIVATAIGGNVTGEHLRGGVEARTNNGNIAIDLDAVGGDPVALRTTNGTLTLAMPESSSGNLSASCVNGNISLTGLTFEPMGEQAAPRGRTRRIRGRINAGGTPIELQTVNGNISISARGSRGN
jgi:Putative adhesin